MSAQVKSRARVQDHGEVFTKEREVNAMLDMVKQETERIDSRFLEPACGDGNFLSEVLRRKLSVVRSRYRRSLFEYEKYAFVAVGSIYGVDILEDNTQECRDRLFSIVEEKLSTRGATFRLSPGGGKATGRRSAWWLRDYPEEREDEPEAKPAVTQEELDSLEPGATVFHKAFGYGSIVDLGDGYVEVAFDNDDRKKKPSRKFMFPGSFFQGLLRIG